MSDIKQKRLTFFDFANLAYGGGCEKNFLKLGAWLQKRGHVVSYVTPSRTLNKQFSRIPGISDYPENINKNELQKELEGMKYTTFGFKDLLTRRKRTRIAEVLNMSDLIISKNEIFEVILLRHVFKIDSRKIVFGVHTPLVYPVTKTLKSRLHNLFYTSRLYFSLLGESRVRYLTVNKDDKSTLIKSGVTSATVIPNPVDTHKFSEKTYSKGGFFEVFYIGRMTEQKGIDVLINAIQQLATHSEFKRMRLTFVGNGPDAQLLKELTKNYTNCTFEGFQNDVTRFYQKADLIVVPSRWESFCYTVAEAQSSGVPVIASDIPGPNDIIQNETTGWLIKPENPKLLAKKILMAFEIWDKDFAKYVQICRSARVNISTRFNENTINLRIERFLVNAI